MCSVSAWETEAAIEPLVRMARPDSIALVLQTGRSYEIVWRPRNVSDQRVAGRPSIRAEEEWLWRWDRTHPRDIFRNGFRPRVAFEGLVAGMRHHATNLREYVANNIPSVFVSTTRRNWTPRARANMFRYDIFAPGGIDVNPTLGSHRFENQMEIAFFSGIRTEFIFGAVELDQNQRQVRYHLNPLYEGPENPLDRRARTRCHLRAVYYPSLRRDQQRYCVQIRISSTKKRSSDNEPMRAPGLPLDAMNDCSYWYKVNVEYLNFDQPAEYGQIEPYGKVIVYTVGDKAYQSSVVWEYSSKHASSAPSVVKNKNLYDLAKCLVVQSNTNVGEVTVCFDGKVLEYDPNTAPDEIAAFNRATSCVFTNPNSSPFKRYTPTFKGIYGRLKIAFTVKHCDENCMKDYLRDNSINGIC